MTYDYFAILWLFSSCLFVRTLYYIMDKYILSLNVKYNTLTQERQMYIQKNIVKSSYLAILTIYATLFVVWPIVSFQYWDNYTIHRLAAMYVSNDIVGLVCVDNLPKTTRIHHITTTVLVFIAIGLDFQKNEIAQAMLVYTMASAAAYIVNFHLGVRWLCAKNELKWLRLGAGVIYVLCCGISWSWHIHWTLTTAFFNIYHVLYLSILVLIVYDDIILMRWLTEV